MLKKGRPTRGNTPISNSGIGMQKIINQKIAEIPQLKLRCESQKGWTKSYLFEQITLNFLPEDPDLPKPDYTIKELLAITKEGKIVI